METIDKEQKIALIKGLVEPEYVWYAKKPPLAGGVSKKIPVTELEKIIGNGYRYSENIYQIKSGKPGFSNMYLASGFREETMDKMLHPLSDKLVIGYVNDKVGHGLFARVDIKPGEIVAIYTGELKQKQPGYNYDYSLDIGDSVQASNFAISSSKIGGIARFMQHLPNHPYLLGEKLIADLKANPKLIEKFVEAQMQTNQEPIPSWQMLSLKQQIYDDVVNRSGEIIKGMMGYKVTSEHMWEAECLDNTSIDLGYIAWSNLHQYTIVINNVPCRCFYAACKIEAGKQIGFPYGIGYWLGKDQLPELFDMQGQVIPRAQYKYTQIPMKAKYQGTEKGYLYKITDYYKAQERRFPVTISLGTAPVSFFGVRKKLVQRGVINNAHAPLALNTFASILQVKFPKDLRIEIFNRYPEARENSKRWIVDLVITAPNIQRWAQLYKLFKGSNIAGYCKCFQYTKEIMISGVNESNALKDFEAFLNYLHKNFVTINNIFTTPIPEELLPDTDAKGMYVAPGSGCSPQ